MFRYIAGILLGRRRPSVGNGRHIYPPRFAYLPGNAVAFVAAVIWSSDSVASSRLSRIQPDAIGAFSLVAGILSAVAHVLF